ncbi:uncharacterized protein LOC127729509 [Mytilus californianus]|uniref:uncharacterized protein LOC127729509 n=1 Tax=Mytilus californianus TaxID=6549 RepID=UPI00224573CE|nr:uncharacterized protein LOC127729509 [Mytilus californianus]
MAVVVIIFYVLFLHAVSSFFNITCPYAHNLYLTASVKCPAVASYTCLYDSVNKNYSENCKGPSKKPPGEKSVINLGNFDTVDCSDERYQSRPFSSTQGTNCILQKTPCNEEGQVIYSNGSTTADRKCRCDYTKNYAFVSTNRSDPCSCDPVQEDCTCLIKKCNNGLKLSSDYKCVPQDERSFTCKEITHFKNENESEGIDFSNFEENGNVINGTVLPYRTNTAIIINGFVFLIVSCMVLLCTVERLNICFTNFEIVADLKDVTCFEHEDVIFTCEVTKEATEVKWCKGDHAISSLGDERFKELKENHIYILKIEKVQMMDRGHYTIKFKEKLSKAELNVFKEDFTFRIKLMLEKVAKPVVKSIFDDEFSPKVLQAELKKRSLKINDLKTDKHINLDDFDLLYPKTVKYKIKLIHHDLEYTSDLTDKSTTAFKEKAQKIEQDVADLYTSVKGQQEVKVLEFGPVFMLITFEITTEESDQYDLKSTLSSAIEAKIIPPFTVCELKNFEAIDERENLYKVSVVFTNIEYENIQAELKKVERALTEKLQTSFPRCTVKVLDHKPYNSSLVVTLMLTSRYFNQYRDLSGKLERAIKLKACPFTDSALRSFEFVKNNILKPLSETFDLRLMIVLLRNLTRLDIADILPFADDKSIGADISRIKFFRNTFLHSEKVITKEQFEEIWNGLEMPLNRLSDNKYKPMMIKLKKKKQISEKVSRELEQRLHHEEVTSDEDEIDSGGEEEHKHSDTDEEEERAIQINRMVNKAARVKFDKEFPPDRLPAVISRKKTTLIDYKEAKQITPTQLESLLNDKPTSEKLELSLLIRLIWILRDTARRNPPISEDDYNNLRSLNSLTDDLSKLSYTEQEIENIFQILRKLDVQEFSSYHHHRGDNRSACGP